MKQIIYKSLRALLFIFVSISFFGTTCRDKDCHDMVKIVNNSGKQIYYYRSSRFPDTNLYSNPSSDPTTFKVNANSYKMDHYYGCVEGTLTTYIYFIFDAQTLETTPWDSIVKHYQILKRYDLSLGNLQSTNFTITYP